MENQRDFNKQVVTEVAKKMAIAARTAPKTRGVDNIEIAMLSENEFSLVADKMEEIAKRENQAFFARDAGNVRNSEALLIIGAKIQPANLAFCGLCGMQNCETKNTKPNIPCAFNTTDLGIAVSSAVSTAMDNKVDNRIMYTVGMAVKELKLMNEEVKIILGIPLSAKGKNIYFDRK